MECESKISSKNVKKSFSAPIKKTTNTLEECSKGLFKSDNVKVKKSKCLKKDENVLELNKENIEKPSDKSVSIKHSKQIFTCEDVKVKKQKGNIVKTPKQLSDSDYEEIFSNVINDTGSSIEKVTTKNDSPLKNKSDHDDTLVNKNNDSSNQISTSNIDENITDKNDSNDDQDSIVSDDIDKWENLSICHQEENETTPSNHLKPFKDLTVAKSGQKLDKQNKLSPKQIIFTNPEFSTKEMSSTELETDVKNSNFSNKKVISDPRKLKREAKKRKSNYKATKVNKSCVQGLDSSSDSENGNCSEPEEKGTWVQCSNSECHKWRYLQDIEDPLHVPEKWECKMNSDIEHNACDLPEVHYDESEHIFTKYTLGSIVWVKMDGYPWWPAMIDNDPDYQVYFEIPTEDSMIPSNFHVTFFGNSATRAWIKPACITPYFINEPKLKPSVRHKKEVIAAIRLADCALDMTLKERLDKYGFVSNFTKKSKILKNSLSNSMLKCSKVNKKIKDNNTTLPTCQTENLNMKNKDITNLNLTDKSMKVVSEDKNSSKAVKLEEKAGVQSTISNISQQEEIHPKESKMQDIVKLQPVAKDEKKDSSSDNSNSKILNISVQNESNTSKKDSKKNNIPTLQIEAKMSKFTQEFLPVKEFNEKIQLTASQKSTKKKSKLMTTNNHSQQSLTDAKKELKKTKNKNNLSSLKPVKMLQSTAANLENYSDDKDKEHICSHKKEDISDHYLNNSEQDQHIEDQEINKMKSGKPKKFKSKNGNHCKSAEKIKQETISNNMISTEQASVAATKTNIKHKNNAAIKAVVTKKLKKTNEKSNTDLSLSKPICEIKPKKKKNSFSVPVPKNNVLVEKSLLVEIPSTNDIRSVTKFEDDSHMVPDVNMSLVGNDLTNEDELDLKIDLEETFVKTTEKNENKILGNNDLLNLNCLPLDNKKILSDDESSDFMLDIETENTAFSGALDEVHGKFGGRCFEHGSDSDPLELIED
ncbi:putative autophagy-related protein 11 isoform X1 [Biomphalaria glabrata]|uniref:Autophagy-related protein 11 isoform X1 n=1 Tax=Biomphalaria glabrata TaxID=6526 RepID=A0A9W2YRA5_BIOGL|nr:putative autophagy-related protein 11 isoform X1 [Biomphalaria glabrata]XP_055865202.1 putative autophagy-related protein 11 isoform X1 [Biomphalaria glabrata]